MIPLRDDLPHRRFPVTTVTLIAVNALIFIFELLLGNNTNEFIRTWGMTPYFVVHEPTAQSLSTLLTSMFLHGGFIHIIGNMYYLWIFGDNVEDVFGRLGFLVVYLVCGLAGAGLTILVGSGSRIPNIGASGAISGVLGAYLVLYPRARVLTLVPIFFFLRFIVIPASVFLLIWILLQVLNAFAGVQSGVAWFAHIGGFAAGLLFGVLARARRRRAYQWH